MDPVDLSSLVAVVDGRHPPDALAALAAAEAVAADLARVGERLVGFYVERARTEGRSWAEIGEHMGISRQAAQQRFSGRWSALTMDDLEHAGALLPFTARTRTALHRAEDHARRLGHPSVAVEHLLLAVGEDDATLAARALDALSVERRPLLDAL